MIVNNLCGTTRTEIKCHEGVSSDYEALVKLLRSHFEAGETLQSLQKALYDRSQGEDETLMDFSRALIHLYNRICEIAPVAKKESLRGLQDKTLTSQFVAGARGQSARLELRRMELANSNKTFNEIRGLALELFRDIERAPKPKYGQVRYLETGSFQRVLKMA